MIVLGKDPKIPVFQFGEIKFHGMVFRTFHLHIRLNGRLLLPEPALCSETPDNAVSPVGANEIGSLKTIPSRINFYKMGFFTDGLYFLNNPEFRTFFHDLSEGKKIQLLPPGHMAKCFFILDMEGSTAWRSYFYGPAFSFDHR